MKTVNIRKKAILALTLGLIVLFTFSSFTLAAQAKINKLDVAIKPEYDKEKTVFQSYTGELSETLQKMVWYMPTTLLEDSTLHFCAIMEDSAHSCQLREGDRWRPLQDNYTNAQERVLIRGRFWSYKGQQWQENTGIHI